MVCVPSRYYLTHDDRVIMASEVGVVPVDPANVKFKGRLEPGRMFLIDFEQGRLIPDAELKGRIRRALPVRRMDRKPAHHHERPEPERDRAQHLDQAKR